MSHGLKQAMWPSLGYKGKKTPLLDGRATVTYIKGYTYKDEKNL